MRLRFVTVILVLLLRVPAGADAPDYGAELPRTLPTSPQDAVATMSVAEGFEIQLIAMEPLIASPVAMEWDAHGALYVCEMRGYSEDRDEGISRIAKLIDVDGDGLYDQRTTFVKDLYWPTGLFPYNGGFFVGDAPDLLYVKDTDGDGVADVRQRVLTGFGTSNVQGLMNSFRWGLDNRIHIACSSVGGQIRDAHDPAEEPGVNIRGRDLALDPKTYHFVATSGAAQHGMAFDDWGNKFASSNSDHIQQVMYRDCDVARNPFYSPPPSRLSIAADGPQAEVYRASPIEAWRQVRTRLRVAGLAQGPIEGGGRAAGYFTGATGVTIYRGDAWPSKWKGLAIVGDVGGNLIHRKRLERSGIEFIARRIDDQAELVASTDTWFRPAQFANAPDGSLHVIDMYREVIEHPASLPPEIKRHLDLTSGRDRGRIYRIVPKGFQTRRSADLSGMSTTQLAALLSHPNAWHRETASRLIYERQDLSIVPLLRRMIQEEPISLGRMHALASLDGLRENDKAALDDATLLIGLSDSNANVRRHAVRLSRSRQEVSAISSRFAQMTEDPSIEVRYELAFALAEAAPEDRVAGLLAIVRQNPLDRWITAAAGSAIGDAADTFLAKITANEDLAHAVNGTFLKDLTDQIADRQRYAAAEGSGHRTGADNLVTDQVQPLRSAEQAAAKEALISRYQKALALGGDRERGRELFRVHCASCHRFEGVGHEVGPSLAGIAARGADVLMTSVLDPNREVNPQYLNYIVLTSSDETIAGVIVDEGATSITIRRSDNTTQTILRVNIQTIRNTGQSFMPEGFEAILDEQAVADLLEYLVPAA